MVYKMKTHILGKDPIVSVVGAPIRWHTMATFPSKHDWIDKTVIPFQAHEGWTGYALKDWKAAYKGSKDLLRRGDSFQFRRWKPVDHR